MPPSTQYHAWSLEVIEAGSGRQACVVPMRAPHDWSPYQKSGLAGDRQSGLHGKGELSPPFFYVSCLPLHRIDEHMRQPRYQNRTMHGSEIGKVHDYRANFGFVSEKSYSLPLYFGNKQSDLVPDSPPSLQEKRLRTRSIFHSIGFTAGKKEDYVQV